MTEMQYRKADSKVLPVSLIIIIGIFLNMLGSIVSNAATLPVYIICGACIVGAVLNIMIYVRLKGTRKCGITMIISTLLTSVVMIICIDSISYYMIAVAVIVMSMAYMNMTITLACGVSTMLIVIGKIAVLIMKGTISTVEAGTTVFILIFIMMAIFYVTKLRMLFDKENIETVEKSAKNQLVIVEKMSHVSENIVSNFDVADGYVKE